MIFPQVEASFTPEDLEDFMQCDYAKLSAYHFGTGMWIRNTLLTEKSTLYRSFLNAGIRERDTMSALILQLFYAKLWECGSTHQKR